MLLEGARGWWPLGSGVARSRGGDGDRDLVSVLGVGLGGDFAMQLESNRTVVSVAQIDRTGFARADQARKAHAAGIEARTARLDTAPIRNTSTERGQDQVEISQMATYLSKMKMLPSVRQNLIDSVRERIANETYETSDKIDAAIEQFLRDER